MAWKRIFSMGWCVRLVTPVALAAAAVSLVSCGSSSPSGGSSSSSAPAAAATASSSPGAATTSSATVGSGTGSSWFVTGSYKGQTLQGSVSVASVKCAPISIGGSSGVEVIWGGTVANTATGKSGPISGDISFPELGSWTIPTTNPHTPSASVVVLGDYGDRYGLSSGVGGLGSGMLTATATSGSVDATFSTGTEMLTLKGSWTCG